MTTKARHTPTTTRLLLAAALGVLALGVLAARPAAAATSSSLQPTDKCWLSVINDWLDNGQVDKIYAVPCYTQAIQHLSQFPDVSGYSSAEDDIHTALLAAIRQDRGGGSSGSGGGGTGGPSSGGPSSPSPGGGNSSSGPTSGKGGRGVLSTGLDKVGPSNAQSVPLPLIVLGALALLLLLGAAATWLARRLQARRPTPAPAPARRP